jgi:23S rRNA-/tRNA-specific pseudouridylate synthase
MLQDFLAERANVARDKVYLAIHHRLDRDTTGVILFTKTKARNKEITDAFRDRTAEKEYLALAEGSPDEDKFLSKRRIDDSADKRGKYSCVDKGGKSAETHFEVLARGALGENRISLIRALPKTGRTHQIRLHLTDLGFPILGDRAYGGQSYSDAAQEKPLMFLHAHKLRILGQEFVAPPPADFTKMILRLKEASSKN